MTKKKTTETTEKSARPETFSERMLMLAELVRVERLELGASMDHFAHESSAKISPYAYIKAGALLEALAAIEELMVSSVDTSAEFAHALHDATCACMTEKPAKPAKKTTKKKPKQ